MDQPPVCVSCVPRKATIRSWAHESRVWVCGGIGGTDVKGDGFAHHSRCFHHSRWLTFAVDSFSETPVATQSPPPSSSIDIVVVVGLFSPPSSSSPSSLPFVLQSTGSLESKTVQAAREKNKKTKRGPRDNRNSPSPSSLLFSSPQCICLRPSLASLARTRLSLAPRLARPPSSDQPQGRTKQQPNRTRHRPPPRFARQPGGEETPRPADLTFVGSRALRLHPPLSSSSSRTRTLSHDHTSHRRPAQSSVIRSMIPNRGPPSMDPPSSFPVR